MILKNFLFLAETTTIMPPWEQQYEKTSYFLTSGNEMDTSPFIVKSKSAKQLELQGKQNRHEKLNLSS